MLGLSFVELIELFIKVLIFPGTLFSLLFSIIVIWFERKFLARMHLRIGPLHVGPFNRLGLFQPIADFLKLVQKEIITPSKANNFLYRLMPMLAAFLSALSIAFIPYALDPSGGYWVIFYTPLSLLVILVILTAKPFIMVGAGWAANNKYCTIGALRAAFQLLAYEIPIVLSLVGIVIVARSFDLAKIVEAQSSVWLIILQPIGFIVILIGMMAELLRRPFDIPLAEQEVVFGWPTEYTGVQFALVMVSEYFDLCVTASLITILFLGGWSGPAIPLLHDISPMLSGIFWFLLKMAVITVIIIMGRGVFPRLRIDQLLESGWTILIPFAIIQILITLATAQWWLPLIGG
ncbi:MAG: NADH-quinone oxidoreductase subunit NuoH [Candidatus Methylarchaceae archaeon HK02M1]|nr:NADH-quinone oxidoreductase subunit NuoH [Candidatus Methylarchaceae archaeon HK01M]MCP8312442.1 NADH-quinone oxidoreductase subunit NuoH [Candidatus Methylarchaceae archaeon HK02M1]